MAHRVYGLCLILTAMLLGLTGCNIGQPQNPSFPLEVGEAQQAISQMEQNPVTPVRPVVIAGGWGGTNLAKLPVTKELRRALGARNVIIVTFNGCKNFTECRRRLIGGIQRALACSDPMTTPEDDVVGVSLGGLVAIDAAAPPVDPARGDARQMKIVNLYTISTPFHGANMAFMPGSKFLDDMMENSDYLTRVRSEVKRADYNIIAYGRMGDFWVGVDNVEAAGYPFYWLPNRGLEDAHHGFKDPRIIADIARRVRGEQPYTKSPPAPLP